MARRRAMRKSGGITVISIPVQVAAICHRRSGNTVEFLLVRTSSGRWIFPKGHREGSLWNCEAAAREAWEEAGAIGMIEPDPICTFRYWKQDSRHEVLLVEAYALEVLRCSRRRMAARRPGSKRRWQDALWRPDATAQEQRN